MFPWRKLWSYITIQKEQEFFFLKIHVDDNVDVQLDVAIGLSYSKWNMEWSDELNFQSRPMENILYEPWSLQSPHTSCKRSWGMVGIQGPGVPHAGHLPKRSFRQVIQFELKPSLNCYMIEM